MEKEIISDNDIDERVKVLKMMYTVVKKLANDNIYCEDSEKAAIINKYGITLISGDKGDICVTGDFILAKDTNTRYITIYNVKTNTKIKISISAGVIEEHLAVSNSGNALLTVKLNIDSLCVIDESCNIVYKIDCGFDIRVYDNKKTVIIKYYNQDRETVKINIDTKEIRVNSFELCEIPNFGSLECIGVYKDTKNRGISINSECDRYTKYKLGINGTPVTKKAYQDITRPYELNETNTLYTHELVGYTQKMGLINIHGEELLEAVFDEISYIGNNCYVISNEGFKSLYSSSVDDIILGADVIKDIVIHDTLPLCILYFRDGTVKLFNNNTSEIFDTSELAKHFDCSYSKERPYIIRVKLPYGTRYITNQLRPITNYDYKKKLMSNEWIAM